MMLPDPQSSPELFDGILIRRPLAYLIDLVMLSLITFAVMVVGVIGGFFSFGLLWVALPIALPLAIVLYYAATLGSPARATLGMRAIDLILTPARGRPLNGWRILIHPAAVLGDGLDRLAGDRRCCAVHAAPPDAARSCDWHVDGPALADGEPLGPGCARCALIESIAAALGDD